MPVRAKYKTPEEALKGRTVRDDGGCLVWVGGRFNTGYGVLKYQGRSQPAHRVAWILSVGPIPEGMFLDHKCFNRSCVELSHLRVVTPKQNLENLSGPYSSNTTGYRGITYDPIKRLYRARVGHNGKRVSAGRHKRLEDAQAAVVALRNKLHTHNDTDRIA